MNERRVHYYFDEDEDDLLSIETNEDDPRWLVEACAEDYHQNHDGWESNWPLEITIVVDNVKLGRFKVYREYSLTFSAYKSEDLENPDA